MNPILLAFCLVAAVPASNAASPSRAQAPPIPRFDSTAFVAGVEHPFFPLRPGTVLVYEDRAGGEVDSMIVTRETKVILGVRAIVVHDRSYRRGALIEATSDWYAQDRAGNVWYLGEDTKEYARGKVVSSAGSWEAGRRGARAGIIMPAQPALGVAYRQEYRAGAAEDMARVRSVSVSVSVPFGKFERCLETEDWSPLEPGVLERKLYAPGVGCVLEETVKGGHERMELVKVIGPWGVTASRLDVIDRSSARELALTDRQGGIEHPRWYPTWFLTSGGRP